MAFLEKLLRSEGLCVSSEYWVLEALIRWVKCDVDSRIDCIDHLFPLIRFPVIPDEYKRKIINDCGDESIRTKLVQIQSNALLDDEQCTAIGRQQRMNCIPSIYILGGGDYSSAAKCHTVSVLDNGRRSWTEAKPMQFDGIGHEATEMNGLIYVAGGFSEQFGDRFRSFYSFDPIDNRWTHLSAMNHGRSSFLLVPFDGFLWAIGGNHSSLVERYDPKSDVWIDRLDYPSEFNRDSLFANSPVSGCIYKNRIILAAQDLVYSYYPKSGEWKRMPNMLRKRHLFKMCVLQDYVYAANCSTIERYSFAENKWQLVASPEKENRVVHINLLAEFQNQILMISSGTKFGRISIYRPETNSWICKETSKKIRYLAAATLCYSLFHG